MAQSEPLSVANMLPTVITTLGADYSNYTATLTKLDVLCVIAENSTDDRYDSYALATFRVTSPCTSLTDSQMTQIEAERNTFLSKC